MIKRFVEFLAAKVFLYRVKLAEKLLGAKYGVEILEYENVVVDLDDIPADVLAKIDAAANAEGYLSRQEYIRHVLRELVKEERSLTEALVNSAKDLEFSVETVSKLEKLNSKPKRAKRPSATSSNKKSSTKKETARKTKSSAKKKPTSKNKK